MLIISHLMVDETSTVPCHAGERLVRELGGLPQSPDQLDQLDVISTLKISYFCKKIHLKNATQAQPSSTTA